VWFLLKDKDCRILSPPPLYDDEMKLAEVEREEDGDDSMFI